MTPARSLVIVIVAVVLLIGARPIARDEQFPHGLLSAEPRAHYCEISTRPLSFGTYDPLAGVELDAVGEIIYVCGAGNPGTETQAAKNIRIEMAQGSSNSYGTRSMIGPGFELLTYNIYLDATHRTVWGDGSGSTEYYFDAKPPNGTPVRVPAFGRIDARQDVPAGTYHDEPAVRILF